MTARLPTRSLRRIGRSFGLAAFALVGLVGSASATDERVRAACTSDYLAYCSQHDPDGQSVRKCMRANGLRLSSGCIAALVAAGEVGKPDTPRRTTAAAK
ncbi:MAG: hypothetical protein NW223_12430 [Hyphomicrobiaceae bacterium]|nr:hypothetical protein [Hyphomicrobiaceae bacterium]